MLDEGLAGLRIISCLHSSFFQGGSLILDLFLHWLGRGWERWGGEGEKGGRWKVEGEYRIRRETKMRKSEIAEETKMKKKKEKLNHAR